MDLINKKEDIKNIIIEDKEKNNILSIQSNNTYHNPFYNHITYLITKENSLIRIESKIKFDKTKVTDDFFEYAYVDILDKKVTKFKIKEQNNKIFFYIQYQDKSKTLFSF